MASLSTMIYIVYFFFFFANLIISSKAQSVPAIYVLGDSLVDVGNNNELPTLNRANYSYNGIDYPGGIPTGRYCNGKNSADLLAEKVGLPSAPPYLFNTSDDFLKGASFASGGSGIFNSTGQDVLSMAQQVDYFGEVREKLVKQVGPAAAQHHLAKSIFVVVTGNNDLFAYFSNNSDKYAMKGSPQQYVDEMVAALHGFLEILHHLGARKLVITAVGPLGCTPLRRRLNDTEECSDKVNSLVKKYNKHLRSMLQQLKSDFNDINYSYFDTYKVFLDLIQNPTNYGFMDWKAACCGRGKLNAELFCIVLFAELCPNRKDHIFWDAVHPTEATDHVLVDMIYNGSQPIAFPINLKQLIAI